jgi:uncharacterized protein HemY
MRLTALRLSGGCVTLRHQLVTTVPVPNGRSMQGKSAQPPEASSMEQKIQALRQQLTTAPNDRDAFESLFGILSDDGQWTELVSLCELYPHLTDWNFAASSLDALAEASDDPVVRSDISFAIGEIFEKYLNSQGQAVKYYQQAFNAWKQNSRAIAAARRIFHERGKPDMVIKLFQQEMRHCAQTPPDQARIMREIAKIQGFNLGQRDEALKLANQAIALDPSNTEALAIIRALTEGVPLESILRPASSVALRAIQTPEPEPAPLEEPSEPVAAVAEPEPAAAEPEPAAAEPEPAAAEPEPAAAEPEPAAAAEPEPAAAAEPEPAAAAEPEPAAAAEPEPAAAAEPEPVATEPEPVAAAVEPEPTASEPESAAAEPESVVTAVEPEPTASEPEPAAAEPEPATAEPAPTAATTPKKPWEEAVDKLLEQAASISNPTTAALRYLEAAQKTAEAEPANELAAKHLARALELAPSHPEILKFSIQYNESNARWADAADALDKLASATPAGPERIALQSRLAFLLNDHLDQSDRAQKLAQDLLNADGLNPDALRAAELLYVGRWNELINLYEEALKKLRRKPGENEVLTSLSVMVWKRVKDLKEAEKFFKRLKLADAKNIAMLEFYCDFYEAEADWNRLLSALQTFRAALTEPKREMEIAHQNGTSSRGPTPKPRQGHRRLERHPPHRPLQRPRP